MNLSNSLTVSNMLNMSISKTNQNVNMHSGDQNLQIMKTAMINIFSSRALMKRYFLDIVFEWEDVLASKLNARIRINWGVIRKVSAAINIYAPWLWNVIQFRSLYLSFVIVPFDYDFNVAGKRNVIPVMIDFWIKDDHELLEFYR